MVVSCMTRQAHPVRGGKPTDSFALVGLKNKYATNKTRTTLEQLSLRSLHNKINKVMIPWNSETSWCIWIFTSILFQIMPHKWKEILSSEFPHKKWGKWRATACNVFYNCNPRPNLKCFVSLIPLPDSLRSKNIIHFRSNYLFWDKYFKTREMHKCNASKKTRI